MKLVVTSDWHIDARTCGVERRAEIEKAVMDGPVATALKLEADYFCFLGDLCDPGGRAAVHDVAFPLAVVSALADNDVRSIWLAGNHDCVLDDRGYTTLDASWNNRRLNLDHGIMSTVASRVGCLACDDVSFLLLPWMPPVLRDDEEEKRIIEQTFTENKPVIALGHRTLPWLIPGSEKEELARAADQPWPDGVALGAVFSANGHHHDAATTQAPDGGTIHVPGSLVRLTFGDAKKERGFMVVDVPV